MKQIIGSLVGALFIGQLIACGGGGTTTTANAAPTANAGIGQSIAELTEVTLSGAGTDSDGTISRYAWIQIAGTVVSLINSNSAIVSFIAPEIGTDETLTFQLTVVDNDGASASDSVVISVINEQLAVEITGGVLSLPEGISQSYLTTVSGTDQEEVSYNWSISNADIEFTGGQSNTIQVKTPQVTIDTTFILSVSVNLGQDSATNSLEIVIQDSIPQETASGPMPILKTNKANDTGYICNESNLSNDCDQSSLDALSGTDFYKQSPDHLLKTSRSSVTVPNDCHYDISTSLYWEKKTDDGGYRDKDNAFNWYFSEYQSYYEKINGGDPDIGFCSGNKSEGQSCHTLAYITYLNASQYCGRSDWRLPTVNELLSIKNFGAYEPDIDTTKFPNTDNTYYYWTNTIRQASQLNIYTVSFGGGAVSSSDATSAKFSGSDVANLINNDPAIIDSNLHKFGNIRIRAVSGNQIPSIASDGLVDMEEGSIASEQLGIKIKYCLYGQQWNSVTAICEGEATAITYYDAINNLPRGWKIPNYTELSHLLEYGNSDLIDSSYFGVPISEGFTHIWTTTPFINDKDLPFTIDIGLDGLGRNRVKSDKAHLILVSDIGHIGSPINNLAGENSGSYNFIAGSGYHRVLNLESVNDIVWTINDTFALDLNISGNLDNGKQVYSIAEGKVVFFNSEYGFIILKHNFPINIGDSIYPYFYSGYMHMSDINVSERDDLPEETPLGLISDTSGAPIPPEHLHFAIYKPVMRNGLYQEYEIESIDIMNHLDDYTDQFIRDINGYHDACNWEKNGDPIYFLNEPWWEADQNPCE